MSRVYIQRTCSDGTTQGHELDMAILQTTLGRLIAIVQQVGLDQGAHGVTLLGHGGVIITGGLRGNLFNCRHFESQ